MPNNIIASTALDRAIVGFLAHQRALGRGYGNVEYITGLVTPLRRTRVGCRPGPCAVRLLVRPVSQAVCQYAARAPVAGARARGT